MIEYVLLATVLVIAIIFIAYIVIKSKKTATTAVLPPVYKPPSYVPANDYIYTPPPPPPVSYEPAKPAEPAYVPPAYVPPVYTPPVYVPPPEPVKPAEPVPVIKKSYGRGVGSSMKCTLDEDSEGGLCYKKCDPGYKGVGPVCWETCSSDTIDTGAFCLKPANTIIMDRYQRTGAGRIPDKLPCNTWDSSWADTGLDCYIPPDIYPKGRSVGWNGSCNSDETKVCQGICGASFVACYKNCKPGYQDDGETCRKTDIGIRKTLSERLRCRSDEDESGGLCYPKCNPGYTTGPGDILFCTKRTCPSEYADTGLTCYRGPVTTTKKSYGRGVGNVLSICDLGQEKDSGLCYTQCGNGYHGVGPVCWEN
jgi:hypothetical protein